MVILFGYELFLGLRNGYYILTPDRFPTLFSLSKWVYTRSITHNISCGYLLVTLLVLTLCSNSTWAWSLLLSLKPDPLRVSVLHQASHPNLCEATSTTPQSTPRYLYLGCCGRTFLVYDRSTTVVWVYPKSREHVHLRVKVSYETVRQIGFTLIRIQ